MAQTRTQRERQLVREARDYWHYLFDKFLELTIDFDASDEQCRRRVELCAELANAALDAAEKRWPGV